MRRRAFSGEVDIQAMMALARTSPSESVHIVDLPYRLSSWALDDPDNVAVWLSAEGELLAWAVMQAPFWTIDYACRPDTVRVLHSHILAWADERAWQVLETPSGRPCWFVMVFADQRDRIRDLERAGFECQADVGEDAWSKVLLDRPAGIPLAPPAPPAGYAIRPLAGEGEVYAYVQLHRDVFGSRNMTTGWRARTLERPEYSSDMDLVAVAPDGRLGAFCICWLDIASSSGQIEPLGVRADCRKTGLGRAILSEGLRRLHQHGASRVLVETDIYRDAALELYQALGFRPLRDVLVYRKDFVTSED